MVSEAFHTWEMVARRSGEGHTDRMSVPGGWIYRTLIIGGDENTSVPAVAMVFVPSKIATPFSTLNAEDSP